MSNSEILVDATGHSCPVPTLKLRRACEMAAPGSILRLLADDPMAKIDAPHYVAGAGLELLGVETSGTLIIVRVRKPVPVTPEGGCGAPLGGSDAPPG